MPRSLCACLVLFLAVGCADPGPRDRSLLAQMGTKGDVPAAPYLLTPPTGGKAPSSVVGLAPDPMANYYSDNAELVLRFEPVSTLQRRWAAEWGRVRQRIPGLGGMELDITAIVRRVLKLPEGVTMDKVRPFALVKLPSGWIGVLPSRSRRAAGPRLRPLDAIYAVVGDPALVNSYEPRFRKGFYFPGQVSLLGKPEALAALGTKLSLLSASIGIDLSFLDDLLTPVPTDVDRIDLAMTVEKDATRIDARMAPRRGSPTARMLKTLTPATGAAQRWLPNNGTLYIEFVESPLNLEALALGLWHDRARRMSAETQAQLDLLRPLLAALGDDAGLMIELDASGTGAVTLVASLSDPDAARAYFASAKFKKLLAAIAGDAGDLEWTPQTFERAGRPVGAVVGSLSRTRILAWRESGNAALATLSVFLAGPTVAHIAVLDDKLVVVGGAGGQADAVRALDHLETGSARDNDHNREIAPLFGERLASASVDLAALFDGCREAAPFWHENGRVLRKTALRWRLPASIAITVEAEALRVALRIRPWRLGEAWHQVRDALAKR